MAEAEVGCPEAPPRMELGSHHLDSSAHESDQPLTADTICAPAREDYSYLERASERANERLTVRTANLGVERGLLFTNYAVTCKPVPPTGRSRGTFAYHGYIGCRAWSSRACRPPRTLLLPLSLSSPCICTLRYESMYA